MSVPCFVEGSEATYHGSRLTANLGRSEDESTRQVGGVLPSVSHLEIPSSVRNSWAIFGDLVSPFSNFGRFIFMLAPGLQLSLLALTIPIWHCMLCAAFFHQALPNHPLDFDFLVSCMYWPGQGVVFNVWTFWYFCNLSSYKILRNCFEVIISCKESTTRAHGCVSFQTSPSVNVTFNLHETVESVTCCSCFGFFSARFFFFFFCSAGSVGLRRQVTTKCRLGAATILGDVGWDLILAHFGNAWEWPPLDQSRLFFQSDKDFVRIAANMFWMHFLAWRFIFLMYLVAQPLVCGYVLTVFVPPRQGHNTIIVDLLFVSSYIARSCFGLSACLKFPVESCFFVMSGYTYKTIVHALHGMNKHGGFGGPLWVEPYDDEVQSIMKRLLTDSDNDKSLTFNNFTDPCSELTKKKQQTMRVFDFADKKKKLPFGPLPRPTGHSRDWLSIPNKPFERPLGNSHWGWRRDHQQVGREWHAVKRRGIIDSSWCGHEEDGWYVFLRITQNGEVCTVDASVAKFARAVRTWKSVHYFYESLVSHSLPEEYRTIGFFLEMTSGKCVRIQRSTWFDSGYMFMRQSVYGEFRTFLSQGGLGSWGRCSS